MARPGHLRTQAYRFIFSEACDHGFQFSSMSAFPTIQTHKSPPGSLFSDSLSLLAHIQSSSWPSSGSCIFHLFATHSTGKHHFSARQRSVFQFIGWALARWELLIAFARWLSRQVRVLRAWRWLSDHSYRIHDTHRCGLRHSLNDGISRTTDVSIVAKHGCVPGYGKNCASALSGCGACVLVTGFHCSAIEDVDHDEL